MSHSPQSPSLFSIDTCRAPFTFETNDNEPLSPTACLCQDLHILVVIGLATPIDICDLRAGLEATLVRHPRFFSIREMTPYPRWVRTTVNLDNHIVVPSLDHGLDSAVASGDKLLEDYLASLSTVQMDHSRPLWEVHVLDLPTSEAEASLVFRVHHAVGDGMSLISLFVACAQSASEPKPRILRSSEIAPRKRPIGGLPPGLARSSGARAFVAWMLACAVLAWHSLVDIACFVAMLLLPREPRTVFTGVKGVERRRKRFISRRLSLIDIRHVKNALNCTINDVLLGVISAALSRYYFRKHGKDASKKDCVRLRLAVAVNMRPTPGIQKLDDLMDPHTHNDAKWGNRIGFMIVPFLLDSHEDPLEYVWQAKKGADRKKYSLEAIFIHKIEKMAIKLLGVKVTVALFNRLTSSITAGSSNMIGPVEQLELFGNRVVSIAPTVYGHRSALTIHWQSYMDTMRVVLAVDDEQFPDSHQLLDDFAEALKLFRDSSLNNIV